MAGNWFGVDIARIERVVPAEYLARLDPPRGAILGTVGLGSRLVSVVDLRAVLGIGYAPDETRGSVLIVKVQPDAPDRAFPSRNSAPDEIGILADEVEDVFFIPARQIISYHENGDSVVDRVIAGESICGGRVISLIDVAGIVETVRTQSVPVAV